MRCKASKCDSGECVFVTEETVLTTVSDVARQSRTDVFSTSSQRAESFEQLKYYKCFACLPLSLS